MLAGKLLCAVTALACTRCTLTSLDDLQSATSSTAASASSGGVGGDESASSTASTSSGAGGSGGSGGNCPSGVVEALRDDFEADTAGRQWTPSSSGGTTIAEIGGELVVTLNPRAPGGIGYAGYSSSVTHDLRDCSVLIRVVEPIDALANGEYWLGVHSVTEDAQVNIGGSLGKTFTTLMSGGQIDTVYADDYPVEDFPWLRLRFGADHVSFEVSQGAPWFSVREAQLAFDVSAMVVDISAGTYDVSPPLGSGTVRFDDVDNPPP